MATFSNILGANKGHLGQDEYVCNLCDFNCCKKYSWDRHLTTSKHIKATEKGQKGQKGQNNTVIYACEICDKEYKDRTGLWRHKNTNKCSTIKKDESFDKKDEIITMLLKQNSELIKEHSDIKDLILEICKNGINNNAIDSHNITTNNTNSHNKAFNIQLYLNETCKNAMNMSEFIESINLQLTDLISVGELGYVEGISKIIIDNLNKLSATERPVNCTDKKRDTIYIKDDNKWEKDEENKKLNKVVKKVAFKNTKLFPQYKQKYPDYSDADSSFSDQYSKIVIESLKDDIENNDKVIKNISKVTTIK